jgi:hypothetical protein
MKPKDGGDQFLKLAWISIRIYFLITQDIKLVFTEVDKLENADIHS